MKMKWIGVLVAVLMSSGLAYADSANVTLYGVINVSMDSVNTGTGGTAATQGTEVMKVSSDASRIGLMGSETVSDDLSAIWQIESLVSLDNSTTNSSTFATRNSFGGLKSNSYGTLLLGRYDTPYKIASRRIDVFGEVLADNRTLMGGVAGKNSQVQFDGRQGDVLAYLSPKLGAFSAAAAYVAGGESTTLGGKVKGSAWSMATMYQNYGLYASLGYEVHNLGSTGTGTLAGNAVNTFAHEGSRETAWKVAALYDFYGLRGSLDTLSLGVAYERTRDNFGGTGAAAPVASCTAVSANCYGHKAYTFSAKYGFDNETLKFEYTRAGNLAGTAVGRDTAATQIALGIDHALAKRTTLYALATRLKNGSSINYSLASAGVTSGTTAAAGNGAAITGVSVGIKHTF